MLACYKFQQGRQAAQSRLTYNNYVRMLNFSSETNEMNFKAIQGFTLLNLMAPLITMSKRRVRTGVVNAAFVYMGASLVLGQPRNLNPY